MDAPKLAAALLICLCFGSIHAYGVLLAQVEQWLVISRTIASMGYALAVAALTLGVYLNGRIEAMFSPRQRLAGCGALAALGLVIAGGFSTATGLLAGFGVMFGLANGIAYAMSLGIAAAAMPGRDAQAMGLATASYGLGAVLCAQLFDAASRSVHVALIFLALAPVIFVVCILGAATVQSERRTGVRPAQGLLPALPKQLLFLWFSYLLGAFAGLMVLAHAPAIALWRANSDAEPGLVSGVVSFGSVAGGYLGGMLGERLPGSRSIALPLVVQAAVLASVPFLSGLVPVAAALGVAGLCYGVLIVAVPVAVRHIGGVQGFARNYGTVFTAWGFAGIAGPVAAGFLYDVTLGYGAALALAAMLSLCSCVFIMLVAE